MKTFYSISVLVLLTLASCVGEPPAIDDADPDPFPVIIDIEAPDGLNINANEFEIDADAPVIVLCHQARFNKHEYDGIAERLNELGFNCIAIDQRSGGPITNHQNWTNVRAIEQGKPVDYLDAQQDINAAVDYASEKYDKKVILWGSSYSSTLALYVGIENDNVSAVVSFSPGDYFASERGSLIEKLASFKKPMFVTSSQREVEGVTALLSAMEMSDNQVQFKPKSDGFHGSRALWEGQPDGDEYWKAIEAFLETVK